MLFPSLGNLPHPEIKLATFTLQAYSLPLSHLGSWFLHIIPYFSLRNDDSFIIITISFILKWVAITRGKKINLLSKMWDISFFSLLYNKQLLNPYKGAGQNWGKNVSASFKNFLNLVVHLSRRMTNVENYSRYTIRLQIHKASCKKWV